MHRTLVLVVAAVLTLSACGNDTAAPNSADRAFLQDMIVHHARAIGVARIGIAQAHDPRVHAFARRIVREQSPELSTMRGRVASQDLRIDTAAGIRMADNRINDAQVVALRGLRGDPFDRRFLALNISSEQGAASMARTELDHGVDGPSRRLATSIASAPHNQIPELKALLTAIS